MRVIDARDHKFSNRHACDLGTRLGIWDRDEVEHCASSPIKRSLPDLPCIVQRKSVLIDWKRTRLSAKMVTVFVSQGGVTYILTVGRSATGVKLKVNSQGLQKLSSHRSNKKLHDQETKRKL